MGRWAEVPCACADRVPVPNSDSQLDRPHRRKRRLTNKQKQELENWEQTTQNIYRCGHRNGMVIELWPGDIIKLSRLITETFAHEQFPVEVFAKVGDWRNYDDELLVIPPREAKAWLAGLEMFAEALCGRGSVSREAIGRMLAKFLSQEVASRSDLERRLNELAGTFAAIGSLRQNVQSSEMPSVESTLLKIVGAVEDATKLCRASIEAGTPILLHW